MLPNYPVFVTQQHIIVSTLQLPSPAEFREQIEGSAWSLVILFAMTSAGASAAFWFIRKWAG